MKAACPGLLMFTGLVLLAGAAGGAQTTITVLFSNATLHTAVRAPDGRIGVLYTLPADEPAGGAQRYLELAETGAPLLDENVGGNPIAALGAPPGLAYDNDNRPHVFLQCAGPDLHHFWKGPMGWSSEVVGALSGFNLRGIRASAAAPGDLYVAADDFATKSALLFSGRQGAWTQELIVCTWDEKRFLMGFDLAGAPDGACHIAYGLQERPSQSNYWNAELYYLVKRAGAWSAPQLISRKVVANLDSIYREPDIAVMPDGAPALVTHLLYNVLTGSYAGSELIYARLTGAGWQLASLANTADNYFGSDGGHHTGWHPALACDGVGQAHVIFSDLASWHIGGYMQAVVGQVRYAQQAGADWTLATLFPQSAEKQEGVSKSFLAVSSNGAIRNIVFQSTTNNAIIHLQTRGAARANQTDYPVSMADRNAHLYVWDNTAGAWITAARLTRPTQITIPNIQMDRYYWVGLWDYTTAALALGEWIGRFNTPVHGRFIGHVSSATPSARIGMPTDWVDITASAGHTVKPTVVNMTTGAWDNDRPVFTSDGSYCFNPAARNTWYWLVFYDFNTGAFF